MSFSGWVKVKIKDSARPRRQTMVIGGSSYCFNGLCTDPAAPDCPEKVLRMSWNEFVSIQRKPHYSAVEVPKPSGRVITGWTQRN